MVSCSSIGGQVETSGSGTYLLALHRVIDRTEFALPPKDASLAQSTSPNCGATVSSSEPASPMRHAAVNRAAPERVGTARALRR